MVNMVQGMEKKREKDMQALRDAHASELAAAEAVTAEKVKKIHSLEGVVAKKEREFKEVFLRHLSPPTLNILTFNYFQATQEIQLRKAELDKAAADFALLSEQKTKKESQLEQVQESLENTEKDIQVRLQLFYGCSFLPLPDKYIRK
mgnify:CR=1 FL=1